jgi:signal transduction histidine kinase
MGTPPRAPRPALYAAAWLPFAAVYLAIFMAFGTPPGPALRNTLAAVVPYAAFGRLVLGVPSRLPGPEGRRARFLAAHAGLALAYIAAGTGGWMALVVLDQRLTTPSGEVRLSPLVVAWQAMICALLYVALSGLAYASRNAARAREEATRVARADALRARAELAALRTQLNPHFLMNTLHTLLGLVRREPALAEGALERLGELLHYGLRLHRQSSDQVELREEWEFVEGYLEIERLRMGERLRLSLEGDEALMDCLVPPFALQPLVENAVQHAIAPRGDGGRLLVSARRCGDRLRLEVRDDGPGLPASAAAPQGTGLGLQLLRDRLGMLYQGRAELLLEPAPEGGLRAALELPLERGRAAEPDR